MASRGIVHPFSWHEAWTGLLSPMPDPIGCVYCCFLTTNSYSVVCKTSALLPWGWMKFMNFSAEPVSATSVCLVDHWGWAIMPGWQQLTPISCLLLRYYINWYTVYIFVWISGQKCFAGWQTLSIFLWLSIRRPNATITVTTVTTTTKPTWPYDGRSYF